MLTDIYKAKEKHNAIKRDKNRAQIPDVPYKQERNDKKSPVLRYGHARLRSENKS